MTASAESTKGLSSTEAAKRLVQYGPNTFSQREEQSALHTFFDEFKSPLVVLLLAAAIISFFTGSYVSATIIVTIVCISSGLDFFISYRSQKAAQKLAERITPLATVIRDGAQKEIAIADVVPGDVVVLEAGKVVPADGKVLRGEDLYVNESSLTGESLPAEKNIGAEVYLGSGVVTGRVEIEVTATGSKTKFSNILSLLTAKELPTEFEQGIAQFSTLVTKVVIAMAIFVFIVNALFNKLGLVDSLVFALALAVGLTPELLPMIIAFNVSRSSIKMSKKGVIVKKLSAIENFGGMDILCTDKTGTLTEDKISLVRCITVDNKDSADVFELAYLTSYFHTGTRNPLDEAIFDKKQLMKNDIGDYTKRDEVPFDFERRRDSLVVEHNSAHILISKGAPENVLNVSTISAADKTAAMKLFDELSAEGFRVLALSTKTLTSDTKTTYSASDEKDLLFQGFIVFIDPPKPEVKIFLDELKGKGITIKIITGDHAVIAEKIAKEVGLVSLGTLNSADIDGLSDAELVVKAENTTIFARVTPEQKNRIIKVLQTNGHVVGYMGDGINDAPALRTADVGISVSNAVDVAKEAADIILVNKSFRELIDGVVEGRRTFANTIKYINMELSSNFGNMFSMTGASILLPFLPMLSIQILLNNLIYDLSQFSLSFDNVDNVLLDKPRPWDIKSLKHFMVVFGIVSSIFDFATFYVLYKVFGLHDGTFQTGWFIESLTTQMLVIFIIRTSLPLLRFSKASLQKGKRSRPHPFVIISAILAVIAAWTIALTSLGHIFGFVPLSAKIIASICLIIIPYLVAVEIAKNYFYKKYPIR